MVGVIVTLTLNSKDSIFEILLFSGLKILHHLPDFYTTACRNGMQAEKIAD
ncbi:MAG: hypothetical protein AB9834_16780 [Lentimicrobium sp.]